MHLATLCQKITAYKPGADLVLVKKAYEFADAAHTGEKRLNGEPLIDHCLAVALLLTDLKMDEKTIAAALLHDVLEHTNITKNDLEKDFGETVANLVDGVTVIKSVKTKTGEKYEVENLRKLLLATAKDVRVVLVRLAEKLDNLKTIDSLLPDKQKAVISKVFDIYAPLAERLGVHHLKWQLEDLAFKFQNHPEHTRIQNYLAETREEREKYIKKVSQILSAELQKAGIDADVFGRPKHFYSIYKKLLKYQKEGSTSNLEKILDKLAVMVLVETADDCYRALAIVHQLFRPLDHEFDDYIAHPKPNGYRALHTTVFGPGGKVVEVQIKTHEMHEYNDFGPASHIYYKEAGKREVLPTERLSWLKNLVQWQNDLGTAEEFEQALKIDVFGDRIFVFTPKGDVLDLPKEATPVDFAYAVHTELGDSCVGAKVDGKLAPLDYQLQTNQMVEILTSKNKKKPSADWLKFIKTQSARSQIRKSLRSS
jgi:guanosine-3',5'-bis(diphosphate) 3'-pyrophosphohydrolase